MCMTICKYSTAGIYIYFFLMEKTWLESLLLDNDRNVCIFKIRKIGILFVYLQGLRPSCIYRIARTIWKLFFYDVISLIWPLLCIWFSLEEYGIWDFFRELCFNNCGWQRIVNNKLIFVKRLMLKSPIGKDSKT